MSGRQSRPRSGGSIRSSRGKNVSSPTPRRQVRSRSRLNDKEATTLPGVAPISAQTPAQTDENRVQDFVLIRNEMTQMQASLAEISRKLGQQSATVNSTSNPTVSATEVQASSVAAPSLTGTVRVPIDSLPSVNIVSQNIRKQIHEHKYVNLALLLIPSMDSDSQTKIIDQDGNQIVVRSNDARLQRHLTIHEFHIAFSRFKNVVCEKEPERRKELDAYSDLIDSMFGQFGGSHFYEYHKSFARKAEQYFLTMGVSVDWSCRDSALYMQTFTGLKTSICDLCSSVSHTAKFCPLSVGHQRFQSTGSGSNRQPAANLTDKYGRTRLYHNGKEICNNFNSTNGCTSTHKNFERVMHLCSICKASTHSALECATFRYPGSKSQKPNQRKQ